MSNKTLEERIALLEKENEQLREQGKIKQRLEELTLDEKRNLSEIAALKGDRMEQLKTQKKLVEELIEIENQGFAQGSEQKAEFEKRMKAQLEALNDLGIAATDLTGALGELEDATDRVATAGDKAGQEFFGGIASHLGLASKAGDNWISKMQVMGKEMKDPKFAENFANQFKQIFTVQNMVASASMAVYEATVAMATQADKVTSAFAKQTGTGTTHRAAIANLGKEYRELGVTQEDAAKAIGSLFDKMPGYTQMAGEQQRQFERLTVTLEKLGVATEDSAALMSDLMKGQKMSADMAMKQTQDLAMMAESLQMRAGEFVKGFREAQKVLAPYGRKSVKIFKNIASAAQAAGVETSALLSLAGKFDTFSDSAETAGKLNAILGSQLSATDLLMQSEDKRIETIIRSMQAQGKSFKDMDKFTQKAIAQTLGIQDLNEAQKILGMDVAGFRNYQKQADRAAKEQAAMEEKAKAAMDSMQKLKMAFANLAQFLVPVIEGFQYFAQLILDASEFMGGFGGYLMIGILALLMLAKIMLPLISIMSMFGVGGTAAGKGMEAAGQGGAKGAAGVGAFGAALSTVTLPILGMVLALVIVVALMVLLIMTLIDGGEAGMMAGAALMTVAMSIYILSGALVLLSTVGSIGAGILVILIGLFVVMAFATAEAGKGIGKAFEQINNFVEGGGSIAKVAVAISALGDAFRNLNVSMKGGGMIQKGLAFIGIGGGAPKKTPIAQMAEDMKPLIDKADELAAIFISIAEVFKLAQGGLGTVFSDMAIAIDTLFKSVDKNSEKGVQVSHTLENLALISTGTSAGTTGFKGVIGAINKLVSSSATLNVKIDKQALEDLASGKIAKVAVR